jgi:DNA-binding FadR family transcriptional regulator
MSDAPDANMHGVLSADLLFRPGRTANAFEETVQRLLQSIRLGLVPPGSRLPAERDLSAMLGVSRDTLREAIAALTEAGYVVSRRGRYGGTFVVDAVPSGPMGVSAGGELTPVRNFTSTEIEDTLVLRSVLEVGATRRAAMTQLAAVDRDRLWRAYEDCVAAPPDAYRCRDSQFHLLIAELVGSTTLIPLMADVRTRINELLDNIPLLTFNIAHSNEQHEKIVKAILHGQPEAAAAAAAEHVAGSESLLRGFLV